MTQYLKKFPFARKLLYENRVVDAGLITGVDLYAFIPVEAYYTNNLMGFGSRLEIDLQTGV